MNRVFPHSDRKGMDAALDMVEATLASLQRRVEKQQQQEERGSEREKRVKDAATNTTPPPPPPSITSSKASKKHRKSKSVLIKRKTHYRSKQPRNSSHSSAQRRFGTQIFEMVAEEVPKAHCTHCNRRPGGAKSQDKDANQERRRIEVIRSSHDDHPERERVKWRRSRKGHTCGEEPEDNVEGAAVREVKQRHIRSRRRREEFKEESDPEFPDVGGKVKQSHMRSHRMVESEEESDLASLEREKVKWKHRKRGHSRRRESDNDLDPPSAREKVTLKHRKGHTRREDSDNDPESPPPKEKVIWRHKRGHTRRESDSDPEQPPAREKVIWRGRSRKEEPDSDPDSPPAREKVILKHRRGHKKREEPEDISQDSSYHRSTQKSQRQARAHSDPEVRERVMWRHGKRGHSRHEGSDVTSEDSSCPKSTHKSRRPRTLCSRPKHTVQESLHARPDEALSSRCRYDTQGGLNSYAGRSRGKHERKVKNNDGDWYKHNRQETRKENRQLIHLSHPQEAVDVDKQGYAQPTLTSRLRVDQSRPKKKEKENILPYIPCGSKSRSYHVGVIAQQEIGRLLSQPLQEHTHTTHSKARGSSQPGCVAGVTETVVRQAMTNIHHHLMGRRAHSDPGV